MTPPSPPSPRPRLASRRLLRLASAVLAAGLWTMVPGSAGAAPAEAPPQLSIAVDDGRTSAVTGDKLAYTITVTNLGTKRVKDLMVTQTLPVGSKLASQDTDATITKDTATWKIDVDPTKKVTLELGLEVLPTPAEVLRLATVACVKVSKKSPPLVCASDSNQLPAGAAAAQVESTNGAGLLATPHLAWYVGGGVLVLGGLAAAAVALVRMRRAPQRAHQPMG